LEDRNDAFFSLVKYFLGSQHILLHIASSHFTHSERKIKPFDHWVLNKGLHFIAVLKRAENNLNMLAHKCPELFIE